MRLTSLENRALGDLMLTAACTGIDRGFEACQRCGSNSSVRLARCVGKRMSTSFRYRPIPEQLNGSGT